MKHFLYRLYGPALSLALVAFIFGLIFISNYVAANCTEGFVCELINHVLSIGKP